MTRLEPLTISPREMDYTDGWSRMTEFILGDFGISEEALQGTAYAELAVVLEELRKDAA